MTTDNREGRQGAALLIGALGVVYGDIGTSPLYALKECFHPDHGIHPGPTNILGLLSLIFWSLILIVTIKYLIFVLRADNRGEGGILALMALAFPQDRKEISSRRATLLITLGVFGAALLYGDGMITPAISVLSAVEGLEVATPALKPFVIPITLVVIVLLFAFQKHGTGFVGRIFGPITLVWFIVLGLMGLRHIVAEPDVLWAINPGHAVNFFLNNGWHGFVVLGSVVLVITGGEALYADMGHFGRKPIRHAWFSIVLPALLLNYFGQGAFVLNNPEAIENPFYKMAPGWALYPLVGLATAATVIASQALISGAYSLTMQAIQLGYCPRLQVDHTSASSRGQIYLPKVNWVLMIACIGLVLGFKSSSNLAAAYGIAVTLTMLITSLLFYSVARHVWKWSGYKILPLTVVFLLIETAFFTSNLLKVPHGGWFTLVVAAVIFTLMSTWKTGRALLGKRMRAGSLPLSMFLEEIKLKPLQRVKGTAVFLAGNPEGTPMALVHNLKHNKVLHERVVIMTLMTADEPHVTSEERVQIEQLQPDFYRVIGRFGFMEDPQVPWIIELCKDRGLELHPNKTTFFLSRETVIASSRPGMFVWRDRLFSFMTRNAQSATAFFHLPPNRVVELGMQVEI